MAAFSSLTADEMATVEARMRVSGGSGIKSAQAHNAHFEMNGSLRLNVQPVSAMLGVGIAIPNVENLVDAQRYSTTDLGQFIRSLKFKLTASITQLSILPLDEIANTMRAA